MTAPTSYTEAELAAYMHRQLGSIAADLGWTVDDGSYDDAVHEVALALGADIATVTNVAYLRLLALRAAWWLVMQAIAGNYDVRSGDEALSRHQVYQQARTNYEKASADVRAADQEMAASSPTTGRSGCRLVRPVW